MTIEETTIPEAPAMIRRAPQSRWRAIWVWGYDLSAGRMDARQTSAEGASRREAVEALIRPLCERGALSAGEALTVQLVELGLDDEIPEFWSVRIAREADGAWGFELVEVV